MHRYTFVDGVYFVTGIKRAALYDTRNGNVYSLNESAKNIILGYVHDERFWSQLLDMGIAIPCDVSCPKHHPHFEDIPSRDTALEFIWFEIVSDDCNERCVHCYANSMPPAFRYKETNGNRRELQRKLTYQDWVILIKEAHDLGCQACQFIGGEPFLYRGENGECVLDMAESARSIGYSFVELFTNATLITPEKVSRIQELNLHIGVTLFSDDPSIHDAITRTPGSHRMTLRALELLRNAKIPTRVGTVVMRLNQQTIASTQKLIQDMGFINNGIDMIRPQGRGIVPALVPDENIIIEHGLITDPNFSADKNSIVRNRTGNSCLAGRIAITDTGDVLPCIFSRSQIIGNVLESQGLADTIKRTAIQTIWHDTKDEVLVCQDCEYRYACFDCRPLSEIVAQGKARYVNAPYPRCTYNPYTGEWGEGVWRVEVEGEPFYSQDFNGFGG
jgi:radical SAM protein with 4Fe4S-binding SPASM domain